MNSSLLHKEHLKSGEGNGWLGKGEADFIYETHYTRLVIPTGTNDPGNGRIRLQTF
jgi:hypothetical protein